MWEQGNQYDLRAIKNALADMFPHGDFLLSSTNENDTYTDIQTLGANLAEEVDRRARVCMYEGVLVLLCVYTDMSEGTRRQPGGGGGPPHTHTHTHYARIPSHISV